MGIPSSRVYYLNSKLCNFIAYENTATYCVLCDFYFFWTPSISNTSTDLALET